jgi:vacuolar-type H+-ATPase subunit H
MDMVGLLDELEALLQRSRHVPGGKVLVDEASIRQLVEQMRAVVPDEIRSGQRIAGERESILADARAQARRLVEEARSQASAQVDDQGLVQAARERAQRIIAEAEHRAASIQNQANQYTASQLANLETRLQRVLNEVQAGQRFLTQDAQAKTGPQS